MPPRTSHWRIGSALLLALSPLAAVMSGCGGGSNFTPLPTRTPEPTPTVTGTPLPTATIQPSPTPFGRPTATPSPTPIGATALDFSSLGSGNNYQGGIDCLGWRFHAKRPLTINSLGFYDGLKDGLKTSHQVGIFDVESRALIVSTTVVPSDTLNGFFRFHYLPSPLTLSANRDYYIMALVGNEPFAVGVSTLSVNPAITFEGVATSNSSSNSTSLLYPDNNLPEYKGDFGPTFRFN